MNKPIPFFTDFEGHRLHGDAAMGEHGNLLLLHGAGASARNKFSIFRDALTARGVGIACFDCIGHGETGGEMGQSSLVSRTRQAQAVIAAQALPEPLSVIGFSMGAYNALKLSQSHQVASLILVVPGMYVPDAYDVPFGPRFSEVIRRERSWVDSDAWDILSGFRGRLLVIAAESDAVIPREIPERLHAAASGADWRKLVVVRGAEHRHLFAPLLARPAEFDALMDDILHCLWLDVPRQRLQAASA